MLKEAKGFHALSNDNKTYEGATASVISNGGRAISTTWEKCDCAGVNEDVPCLHSDPKFSDCPPGETVRVKGALWFHSSN